MATLKQLFDQHQIVFAVWQAEDFARGPGFLTLKVSTRLLRSNHRDRSIASPFFTGD
jgi:hypothetical protein